MFFVGNAFLEDKKTHSMRDGKWYFCIVDVTDALAGGAHPTDYNNKGRYCP